MQSLRFWAVKRPQSGTKLLAPSLFSFKKFHLPFFLKLNLTAPPFGGTMPACHPYR